MANLNGQIFLKILTFCNPYDPKNEKMLWNCGILNFQENSVTLTALRTKVDFNLFRVSTMQRMVYVDCLLQ